MKYSENLNFYLPSRDDDDVADINQISENFITIDKQMGVIDEALGEIIEIQEGFISSLPSAEGASF